MYIKRLQKFAQHLRFQCCECPDFEGTKTTLRCVVRIVGQDSRNFTTMIPSNTVVAVAASIQSPMSDGNAGRVLMSNQTSNKSLRTSRTNPETASTASDSHVLSRWLGLLRANSSLEDPGLVQNLSERSLVG